ncbi:MAG: heme A synthase [Chitinophagaceae bacterium]|nr:MAG: heme A synthase [Chitinophagaceae bacterium]
MDKHRKYLRFTWFLVIWVFLVIIAGGVVRTTQSGMGCPDWPTCFGRWIPPTSVADLPADYEKYLRAQDIDHSFNALHTWIESINRYLGALLGIICFIHLIWSFRLYRKTNKAVVWLSLLLVLLVGFQGWLGKKVVDHNLAAAKITTHMLVALLIAALPLIIIYRFRHTERKAVPFLKNLTTATIIIILVQIVLGTQVREQIDETSKSLAYQERELWMSRLDNMFIIHRSFSWLVLAACLAVLWKSRPFPEFKTISTAIFVLVLLTLFVGLIMMWAHIPAWAQPLHLLLACILVLTVFTLRLRLK